MGKKYKSGVQLRILKLIEYADKSGLEYVTVEQLEKETGLSKADVSQAVYELHKKGDIQKPDDATKQDGKWILAEKNFSKKDYQLICKHLAKEDGRFKCRVKNVFIGDLDSCKPICGFNFRLYYKCPSYENTISNKITIEHSRNLLRLWEAKEIGMFRKEYGSMYDPESKKYSPKAGKLINLMIMSIISLIYIFSKMLNDKKYLIKVKYEIFINYSILNNLIGFLTRNIRKNIFEDIYLGIC